MGLGRENALRRRTPSRSEVELSGPRCLGIYYVIIRRLRSNLLHTLPRSVSVIHIHYAHNTTLNSATSDRRLSMPPCRERTAATHHPARRRRRRPVHTPFPTGSQSPSVREVLRAFAYRTVQWPFPLGFHQQPHRSYYLTKPGQSSTKNGTRVKQDHPLHFYMLLLITLTRSSTIPIYSQGPCPVALDLCERQGIVNRRGDSDIRDQLAAISTHFSIWPPCTYDKDDTYY